MKEKIMNFTKENLIPVSVTAGATLLTPFISCGISDFTAKNFGLNLLVSLVATGSAIGTAVLDNKFGPDLYEKIYSGDNQYIKATLEYGIPSYVAALATTSSTIYFTELGVIPHAFSAMAQTAVLKHFDTVSAFEEAFFGEEIGVTLDPDQTTSDLEFN